MPSRYQNKAQKKTPCHAINFPYSHSFPPIKAGGLIAKRYVRPYQAIRPSFSAANYPPRLCSGRDGRRYTQRAFATGIPVAFTGARTALIRATNSIRRLDGRSEQGPAYYRPDGN